MAIDNSILTDVIYLAIVFLVCLLNYRKNHNVFRSIFLFLWVTSIYFVLSCCIFPIQFSNTGIHMISFWDQFSIMSLPQLKKYFLEYLMYRISYLSSFLCLSFTSCYLFKKIRKIHFALVTILGLMLIHLVYNVSLNVLLDEVVKSINAEDFYLMIIGFFSGWICAKIALAISPTLAQAVLESRVKSE